MKRILLGILGICIGFSPLWAEADTDISQYSNIVYAQNLSVAPGDEATLSIQMNNVDQVIGFNFKLVLPNGVTVVSSEDDWGDVVIDAALSGNRTNSTRHTFETALSADGALNVLCYSTKNNKFVGNSGEVAVIKIKVASTMSAGDYPVVIKNEAISLSSSTPQISYIKSTLTIKQTVVSHKVSTMVYPASAGIISGPTEVENMSTKSYTATANSGYEFASWLDGVTTNPRQYTITSDTTLSAVFSKLIDVHDTTYIDRVDSIYIDRVDSIYFDVHDTTYIDVHDTTYIDVHDTTYIDVHDTTYIDRVDSIYIDVHDTTYIDVHDTTYIDRVDSIYIDVHDTTYIDVHDTTYIDRVDSIYIDVHDTTYIDRVDSIYIDIHDTTYIDVHDTTYIDRVDSIYFDVHDTTYIDVHDTTYIDVHDTTYIDRVDSIYIDVHDTTYIDVHDTTYIDRVDSIYIDVHDTTYIDVHDTTYLSMLEVGSMNPLMGSAIIQILAIPEEGYQFLYWSDYSTDNPRTIEDTGIPQSIMAIFSSSTPTANDEVKERRTTSAQKQIRNNSLYILRDGKTYNAQGAEL